MEGKKKENLSRSGAQHSVFSVSSWEIFMSVVFAKKQVCVKACQGLSGPKNLKTQSSPTQTSMKSERIAASQSTVERRQATATDT